MSGTYDVGDLIRMSATFTDINGNPIGPSDVRFLVRDPASVVTIHTTQGAVVTDSSAEFHLDVTADQSGKWLYRCESSTGVGQAAEESWFRVLVQQVST